MVGEEEEIFLTYYDVVTDDKTAQLSKPTATAYPMHINHGGNKRLTATAITAKLIEKTRMHLLCNPFEMGKLLNRLGAKERYSKGRKTYMMYEKSYEEIDFMQRNE